MEREVSRGHTKIQVRSDRRPKRIVWKGPLISMVKEMQPQRDEKPESARQSSGQDLRYRRTRASNTTAREEQSNPNLTQIMEEVIERSNMTLALKKVEQNKGAAGIDNISTDELRAQLKVQWPLIKEDLLNGNYQPKPVRRVEIPKPGGGVRKLGIPTVIDRFIQQALHQVLTPIFEPQFSNASYGFRPGRSAHQAVLQARQYVEDGRRWVVDIDLEKFFDRVNHDILMSRIARRVKDKRVLILIRRYLQAGIMENGLTVASVEGTPQGGPLSPLLSNILLDDLDKELERRGHEFCRYADDCNIYVQSRRAGERLLESITRYLEGTLKLRVNREKSAVARPWQRKFLGYSMTSQKEPKLKVAPATIKRFKEKLKETFHKGRGRNLGRLIEQDLNPILRGWGNYFIHSHIKITYEELDSWIRRRLRQILWKQWKRNYTRRDKLIRRGIPLHRATESSGNGRGSWWNSGASHMNEAYPKSYFDNVGLISLLDGLRWRQRAI
jgi:RNA-directed DNA polymerase